MDIVQFAVSILLFFVLFFGISFLLNMILRMSWFMLFVYPAIVFLIVDDFPLNRYFREPVGAISDAWASLLSLSVFDIIILVSGFAGTVAAGIIIRLLRKNGYQMF
ncbi:YuiB family protein [Salimicrobium flavidum]|uniref:Putative membrane protein n=1 Tax=Salimicrobium flavidum TaxID=570947 RepID=A0A1N7J3I9_9BACI|nr:YuiB family protein [Salimicrobium flavidum]SIS43910.1 Putative membrane protein [Salimicrobium flavidum]